MAKIIALDCSELRLRKAILVRMFGAGTIWGLTMGAGLVLLKFRNCGLICFDDVATTTALALAAGNLIFGPLVVLGSSASLTLKHKQPAFH